MCYSNIKCLFSEQIDAHKPIRLKRYNSIIVFAECVNSWNQIIYFKNVYDMF